MVIASIWGGNGDVMKNMLLCSVEINPMEILSRHPDLELNVNAHEYMTNKESEKIQELLGEAAQIVMTAMVRSMNDMEEN